MDKKVEELVEWVATEIKANTCRACWYKGEKCEGCTWLSSLDIEKLAREILSHPDLALIDRDKKNKLEALLLAITRRYRDGSETKHTPEMVDRDVKAILSLVIPLAEAMKKGGDNAGENKG